MKRLQDNKMHTVAEDTVRRVCMYVCVRKTKKLCFL